ncbi:MAG: redox-regulated ATPase YchF [Actinobacteria bacterium]|nr:redox-regulated ATPase YchF [Actinomycetota bacterium]
MQVGIIGLPNAGKTTIFNSITRAHATVASYPFCTIEPNQGIVNVFDSNLKPLSKIYDSQKLTFASIKILDVAGLVEGASRGEGLGNRFLANIREVDVIAHIIRCFVDENVAHPYGEIDPVNDIDVIKTELILADIETLSRRLEKYTSTAKSGDADAKENIELINNAIDLLNNSHTEKALQVLSANRQLFTELNLLSLKPMLFIANVSDEKASEILFAKLAARVQDGPVIKIYGKIENELCDFPEDEQLIYREELGIGTDSVAGFIKKCYFMLDLITFYTINKNEARAWSLKRHSGILEAAGKIHSDMQKGFIKAEVINCGSLLSAGSVAKAREEGMIKLEGREYTVMDGDVLQIKFNV